MALSEDAAIETAAAEAEIDSRVSWIAEWFHCVPHIDYTFHAVNNTFDPRSNLYLESLGIIASLPGFWLILNLLAFLIFFLSRCCEREWKPRNLTCYKWTLAFFALLCGAAIGAGLYGNHEAHDGIEKFADAAQNINSVVTSVKNQTVVIEQTLKMSTDPELDRLEEMFGHPSARPPANETIRELLVQAVRAMRQDVANGTDHVAKINLRLRQLDLGFVPATTHHVEFIRWPATMALLSVFLVFCLVLLGGVIKGSRSTLIAFTVLGLLAVILNWLLVSIYLATCVALSDLCIDPDMFMLRQASGVLDRSIVNYYVDCNEHKENPFEKALRNGQRAVDNVESRLDFVNRAAGQYYHDKEIQGVVVSLKSHVDLTQKVLSGLPALLVCQHIHHQYDEAVTATCTPALNGLAFMLMSAASAGLLFILLIWIAAHTWMYIRKRMVCAESDYVQVDEHDPFLPPTAVMVPTPTVASRRPRDAPTSGRPRHSHTPPQTPPFPGTYNGRIPRGAEDHSPLHGRYTPPPSYEQLSAFLPSAPVKS